MKKIILTAFCLMCAVSLSAQQSVPNAAYEKLFATAQKYESEGRWFYALAAWYDCMESDLSGSDEAVIRYEKLKARIESGDPVVWQNLDAEAGLYWEDHFSTVFIETCQGVQNDEYVIQYDIGKTERYQELEAVLQKGRKMPAKPDGKNIYDCVLQLSVVYEDGTVLVVGTPQIAGGRYAFSSFPRQLIPVLASGRAVVQPAVVAVRNKDGKLVRVPGGEQFYRVQEPVAVAVAEEPVPAVPEIAPVVEVPVVYEEELQEEEVFVPVQEEMTEAVALAEEEPEPEDTPEETEEISEEPEQEPEEEAPETEEPVEEEPEETLEKAEKKKSPVIQFMKQREQDMIRRLDETPERTLQLMYVGISHDVRPQLGTYVSAPVLGNAFIGLNWAVGMKKLSFSFDAMIRGGLSQTFGKVFTVGVFGIAGVYDYHVTGAAGGTPPVTAGVGVLGEVVILKMAADVSAWTGYSLDGKLATNVSVGFGWKLDK